MSEKYTVVVETFTLPLSWGQLVNFVEHHDIPPNAEIKIGETGQVVFKWVYSPNG